MKPSETNIEIFPISESKRRFSSTYKIKSPDEDNLYLSRYHVSGNCENRDTIPTCNFEFVIFCQTHVPSITSLVYLFLPHLTVSYTRCIFQYRAPDIQPIANLLLLIVSGILGLRNNNSSLLFTMTIDLPRNFPLLSSFSSIPFVMATCLRSVYATTIVVSSNRPLIKIISAVLRVHKNIYCPQSIILTGIVLTRKRNRKPRFEKTRLTGSGIFLFVSINAARAW